MKRTILAALLVIGGGLFAEEQTPPCPVLFQQVHPHWTLGSGDPWGSYLYVSFKNVSPKKIIAIRLGVSFVDALGDKHEAVFFDSDSPVKIGKASINIWADGVNAGPLGHKVGAIVWAEKVRFEDDSFFTGDASYCGAKTKTALVNGK